MVASGLAKISLILCHLQSESTRKNCNSYDHVDQMNNGDNFNIESTSKRTQQLQTIDLKYATNTI